ncbi:MAG: type II secretion system protein [Pseudomonadota bacterium]
MRRARTRAFTLIELIFVMFLISLLSSMALPKVSNMTGINLRNGATGVAGFVRAAYEHSVMRHQKIRIRFDLERRLYWAESYEEPPTIPLLDEDTKLDKIMQDFEKRDEHMRELSDDEKKAEDELRYKKLDAPNLKPKALPQSIHFKGVYTASEGKSVETGVPWVDLSPGGFVQKTIIYVLNDRDDAYSVILEPLGGRTRVEKGELRPDEV